MIEQQVDVLIIGGGLTGATLLLALQNLGLSCLLVEQHPFSDKINADFDARSLALSPASQRVLTMLGVWPLLAESATAIDMIHVSEQQGFGMSRLHGEKDKPLGYVVEMQYINHALLQLLPAEQVLAPAQVTALNRAECRVHVQVNGETRCIKSQLIVAADGADSLIRQLSELKANSKAYNQQAIVANIELSKAHQNRAYERFTSQGPLALLPMQGRRMSLVWAMSPQQATRTMALSDSAFLALLQGAFGYRLGRFSKAGIRSSFNLKQVIMPQQTLWPLVFIGNAAHTLHPVAGQGFNLGLRDVATLAQCIAQQGLNEDMLASYQRLRAHDQRVITQFTDGLIKLFTSKLPGLAVARNLGLIALDNNQPLKNILARYTQGFGGVIPDLVCEKALQRGEGQ